MRFVRLLRVLSVVAALAGVSCTPAKKREEVVFWQFTPSERIQPLLEKFQKENPAFPVRMELLTWDGGQEKIAAAVASGNVPDLCELGSTWMPRFLASGSLADWTDSVSDLRGQMRGWELCASGGRLYGLPWVLGTRALYFNRELFARAGLDSTAPPETWAELEHASAVIQKLGGGIHGYGVQSNEQYRLFKKFMPYAWGNGGDVLDSAMTRAIFDSRENREALEFYVRLLAHGTMAQQDQLDREFLDGRLGLQISGGWLLRRIPKEAPALRYGLALVPKPAAGRGTHASFAGGEVLVSFRTAKHAAGALALARFLARPDNALALAMAAMDVQPAALSADTAAFYREHPDQQVLLRQFETAHFTPMHPAWGDMEKAIEDEVEQALYAKKTPAQAVRDANAKIAALLVKH